MPVAMGFDLTEGWAAGLKEALEPLGVTFEIRDPNWSTDAGAQAITSLISEKPDVIVVHNPDVQSYARLLKKAEEAGIYVVQVNMRSSYSTDVFVGADYVGMGEQIGQRLVDKCSPANGGSGKVAITQGVLTAAASIYQMQGINNVLSKHPEIQLVSNQAADWDCDQGEEHRRDRHPAESRPLRHHRLLGRHGRRHRRGDQGVGQERLSADPGRRQPDGLRRPRQRHLLRGGRLLRAGPGPRHGEHDQAAAAAQAAGRHDEDHAVHAADLPDEGQHDAGLVLGSRRPRADPPSRRGRRKSPAPIIS